MGWSAWIPMGNPSGGFVGRPATIARNPQVTNIYVRGADNSLWQRAYWNSIWHAWGRHDDGGVLASAPSLGSMGPDHEQVFVRGTLIGGEDLTPLKARILLMLALTKTHSPTDIQRMFTEY